MKRKLLIAVGLLALGAATLGLSLPAVVHARGLHPTYEGETFDLKGSRALVITTSHGVLNAPGETEGDPTGVMASEFTHPYYGFLDAGMEVDIASVRGGPIPIDPQTLNFVLRTPEDERFLEDPILQAKVKNSLPIEDVDFTEYDAIFIDDGSPPESPWTQPDGRKGCYGDSGDDDDHPGMHHRGAMLDETPAFAAAFGRRRRVADVRDTPEEEGVTPAGQSQYEGSWIVDDEDDVEEEVDGSVEGGGWGTGGGGW